MEMYEEETPYALRTRLIRERESAHNWPTDTPEERKHQFERKMDLAWQLEVVERVLERTGKQAAT